MRKLFAARPTLTAAVVTVFLSACSGNANLSPSANLPLANPQGASTLVEQLRSRSDTKIQHVIIIIQENRSFDNLFQGFPGADTRSYGYNSSGQKIELEPVGLATKWDLDHSLQGFFAGCNGQGSLPGTDCQMNGFNLEWIGCGGSGESRCPNANPPYSYVPRRETKPYFAMAEQYVLADRMFASNLDASFVSHQYIIAAQASSSVNTPADAWGCEGGSGDTLPTLTQQRTVGNDIEACFDNRTLGDELDKAGLSWRYYTSSVYEDGGEWSPYQAIKHIYYGKDWSKDVITPQTQFFADVSNGKLPVVSWITPTCENSDHAGCGSNTGPSWVASLVNAVGESKYWKSTAIFVFWDDWGGWYDHVPPKIVDYDGLGIRLPLLVISPYAKKGHVSHVHYETSSILRFIEDRFALPRLSVSDQRATSPEKDCFDFAQSPRAFSPIPSDHDKNYFIHQPLDRRPVDSE